VGQKIFTSHEEKLDALPSFSVKGAFKPKILPMKTKSTSHSASENPSTLQRFNDLTRRSHLRLVIGLCVFITGIFLALLAFGPATSGFAQGTSRAEMTLTLAKALDIVEPPACVPGQEMFDDVPATNPFCPWIEELVRRGITTGCAPNLYCPSASVTRAQMAPFLVKATDAITQSEAFHLIGEPGEPPFQNGWANLGSGFSAAGFFKDALSIVHLKGTLNGPGDQSTAFTLPEGYRPAENLFLPAAGGGANPNAAILIIFTNGELKAACDNFVPCPLGMDGLAFRVP
jgi:hypothetical protein